MISGAQADLLVLQISRLFGSDITPSEARALVASPTDERSLGWMFEVLREYGIEHEEVENITSIDFENFGGVGIVFRENEINLFYLDESKQVCVFRNLETGIQQNFRDFLADGVTEKETVFRFFLLGTENLAPIPGIETHWFLSSIWENRGYLFQAGVASLITNLFAVGTSLFAMVVYNRIIPSNAMSSLTVLVIGMIILLVADYLVKTSRSRLLGFAGIQSDILIADRLFKQVLDIKHQAKTGTVGQLANVLKEYEQIREFFTSATLVSMIDLPFALIFVAFIWYLGGAMVLPVVAGIAVLFLITLIMQPRMRKIAEISLQDAQDKHSILVETLSGLETLKMLGAGGILRRRFKNVLVRQSEIQEETKRQMFFAMNLTQEVQQAVQIAVVAVGAILVSEGEFGFGAIIACTILSGKALMPFAQLAQLLGRLNQVMSGYRALNQIMNAPCEHESGMSYVSRGRFEGRIGLSQVSFQYPGREQQVLTNVSFSIEPGESVAIVGRIGSGKTTIGKLITKLYLPDEGRVSIDGIDVSQLDPAEIRENLGVVSQEPWLIAGTLEQNILLGVSTWDTEKLLFACEVSGVSDFSNLHPDGLKMIVSERGEGLSGGQKQAIALARAIVREPSIYLLDEPTSSMDAKSERVFIQRFKQHLLNKRATKIIITHRTSLLALVDRVLVMDGGRLISDKSAQEFIRRRQPVASAGTETR